MKHLTVLGTPLDALMRAQFGLRIAVCRLCSARPTGSETLGADLPRRCETGCQLFKRLPDLLETAICVDPMVGSLERSIEAQLTRLALLPPRSANAEQDQHPWSHHKPAIVGVLQNLVRN
jgi:hypothetical protein